MGLWVNLLCALCALTVQPCLLTATSAAHEAAAVTPAPGPAPSPGAVGEVVEGLLVSGLAFYNSSTQSALASAVVTVANGGAPTTAPIVADDVLLSVATISTSESLVLQGLSLAQFPTSAAGTLCFEDSVAAVTGVPVGSISVRPPQSSPLGVQVPFYVYSTNATVADRYLASLATLNTPAGSAALVSHLASCGIVCQGVLQGTAPSLAVSLYVRVALSGADAASQAAIVAALGHTTAYVLALRAEGLPSTVTVQISTAARYAVIPSPPPPQPPHPPRPSPPPHRRREWW